MNARGWLKEKEAGVYFLLALCTVFLLAEIINHRFWLSDLEVYYRTAGRLWEGKNLYRYVEDGHYVFKYSPVSAAFFIPLLLLPFSLAKIVYWLFLSFIIAKIFRNSLRCASSDFIDPIDKTRFNSTLIFLAILFAVHYLRELHLGQVNFLLLACYVWSAVLLENNKPISYGFLIAATLFLKPFGLIFIPWLILNKKFRETGWIITALAVLALIPLIFYRDFSLFTGQYQAWMNELKIELANKQSLFKPANHTIFSVIARYTPLGYLIEEGSSSQRIYQLIVLALTALLTALYIRKEIPACRVPVAAFYDLAFLTALIPLLSFTSENAFLFTLPAAVIVFSNWHTLPRLHKMLAVAGLLLIGGNFSELTGKKLSQWLDNWSVLTPGTLLMLFLLFYIRNSFIHSGKRAATF